MSPLELSPPAINLATSSIVVEGMVKIQPITDVEEKVLHSLGWTDIDFKTYKTYPFNEREETHESQTQMYYEFGIFSTFYGGDDMPNCISYRRQGGSILFTIPSSPKIIRGLNFCHVQTPNREILEMATKYRGKFNLPRITIRNLTQNHTWIYRHCISPREVSVGEKCLTFLSHWMFRMNEMVGGDCVFITVKDEYFQDTKECGISFLYNDESNEEEEDVLGYYKSWNHIIGGDLSGFQLKAGEYQICNENLSRPSERTIKTVYKEDKVSFRAFSKRKSDILIQAHEDVK